MKKELENIKDNLSTDKNGVWWVDNNQLLEDRLNPRHKQIQEAVELFLTGKFTLWEISDITGMSKQITRAAITTYMDGKIKKKRTGKISRLIPYYESEEDLFYKPCTFAQLEREMPLTIYKWRHKKFNGENLSYKSFIY